MKIPVHMTAYETKKDIREVTIPDNELGPNYTQDDVLSLAFQYGQNDFQPMQHPSVSVGDVIEYSGKYFIVLGIGFKEIDERAFKGMPDQVATKMKWMTKLQFGE